MPSYRAWKGGASAVPFSVNCQPVGFYQGGLVYTAYDHRGVSDAMYMGQSLTSTMNELTLTNRGAYDVNGSKVLIVAAVNPVTDQIGKSAPGRGESNEVWLYDLATRSGRPLVTGRLGVIGPYFFPSGDRLVWTEMTVPPSKTADSFNFLFGYWEIHVADITPTGIANEISWPATAPGFGPGFYETYPPLDDQTLIFASDFGFTPPLGDAHWLASQICTMPALGAARPTRLSAKTPQGTDAYHEFAFLCPPGSFTDGPPGSEWVIFGRAYASLGLDYWRQLRNDTTGQSLQRVTFFNQTSYVDVGALAWLPGNPKSFLAGLLAVPMGHPSAVTVTVS